MLDGGVSMLNIDLKMENRRIDCAYDDALFCHGTNFYGTEEECIFNECTCGVHLRDYEEIIAVGDNKRRQLEFQSRVRVPITIDRPGNPGDGSSEDKKPGTRTSTFQVPNTSTS
jgi:hypothetical protein